MIKRKTLIGTLIVFKLVNTDANNVIFLELEDG